MQDSIVDGTRGAAVVTISATTGEGDISITDVASNDHLNKDASTRDFRIKESTVLSTVGDGSNNNCGKSAVPVPGSGNPVPNQDPARALLSLGHDLSEVSGEAKENTDGEANSNNSNKKKRKLESSEEGGGSACDGYTVDGVWHPYPPDFWYWLPTKDIGDWDVLCGRGGESNNYLGNKRYRNIIKDRKVRHSVDWALEMD
jgi:hypothetical protein